MFDLRHMFLMKTSRPAWVLAATGLVVGALGLASCSSQELFTDRDQTAGRLRYFDSDSASATRQHRQQAEMGMGMPSGPSAQ